MAHILLAEDNSSMRSFLGSALRKAGHQVDMASDGVCALAELQTEEKPYDLLLADVVMPGMDGVELARRASDLRPDMKVVFITGFAGVSLTRQTAENTAMPVKTKVLSQPFHLKDLVKTVDRLLAA